MKREFILNRMGDLRINHKTSNQCKEKGWHPYHYQIKLHAKCFLNSDGFVIDHAYLDQCVQDAAKASGSCEELCLRVEREIVKMLGKHKVRYNSFHFRIQPVGLHVAAFMEFTHQN
jgi:hypothetical protein